MQTILQYAILFLTGMILQAQNTIEVSMTQLGNNEGVVRVGLYNEAGQFLEKTYLSKSTSIEGNEARVTFLEIPDGTYAISCYHDEDNNGKLNMFMGMMPKEDYACSNGAKGFFGPPKWEDAYFTVSEGEVKDIEIKF